MITDCGGMGFWDMTNVEPVFIRGTCLILTVAVPAAICLASWKLHVARKRLGRRTPSVLAMNEATEPVQEIPMRQPGISPLAWLIYTTSAVVAFDVGYLANLLRQLLF